MLGKSHMARVIQPASNITIVWCLELKILSRPIYILDIDREDLFLRPVFARKKTYRLDAAIRRNQI